MEDAGNKGVTLGSVGVYLFVLRKWSDECWCKSEGVLKKGKSPKNEGGFDGKSPVFLHG